MLILQNTRKFIIIITHDRIDFFELSQESHLSWLLYHFIYKWYQHSSFFDIVNSYCLSMMNLNYIQKYYRLKIVSLHYIDSKLSYFGSKLHFRKTKVRLYVMRFMSTFTYCCEVWTTTSVTEKKTFGNKIWRRICSPGLIYYDEIKKKSVKEGTTGIRHGPCAPITSCFKGQKGYKS